MRRFTKALLALLPILVIGLPEAAPAKEFVRDQIRINMRSGPGKQFRILRVLVSGEAVDKLAETDGWLNVRAEDGQDGWVPDGYLVAKPPASVALPRVEARLSQAQARVDALEQKLAGQKEAIAEIDTLRARNLELETANVALTGTDRWKTLGVGGAIALLGVLIGAMWPRAGAGRTRRIKL